MNIKSNFIVGIFSLSQMLAFGQEFRNEIDLRKDLIEQFAKEKASKKPAGQPKQISGSLTALNGYTAVGVPIDINLFLDLEFNPNDLEFGDQLTITFPPEVTINSVSNDDVFATVVSEFFEEEAFNGISGQTVSWGDNDNVAGGIIPEDGPFPFSVNITVAPGTTNDLTVNYIVSGDGFGPSPGPLIGSFIIPQELPVIELPVTFELPQADYNLTGFNGVTADIVSNPDPAGVNTSPSVLRQIQNANDPSTFGGAFIDFSSPIAFEQPYVAMDVWVPSEQNGTDVNLKFEVQGDPFSNFIEASKTTTTFNTWETLIFDFSEALDGNTNDYVRAVLFFNVGSSNTSNTYFCDNIRLVNSPLSTSGSEMSGNFTIYPNPANSQVVVAMDLTDSEEIRINVVNALGQIVKSVYLGALSAGSNIEYLDVSELSEGLYFVNVSTKNTVTTQKVQIAR